MRRDIPFREECESDATRKQEKHSVESPLLVLWRRSVLSLVAAAVPRGPLIPCPHPVHTLRKHGFN